MLPDAQLTDSQFIDLQRAKPRFPDGQPANRNLSNRKCADRHGTDCHSADRERQ